MITGLKPYPAMKPSGVEWLGDIPDHWPVQRAKWLFRNVERPVREIDEVVTCFRDGTVTLRRNRRLTGFTEALKEIGYQGVRRGDLVIHMMDAFAGAIGVSDSDGKCTPVYAICEAGSLANPHYYARVVREMARRRWILALSKGVRERSTDFRFAAFADQRLPVAPLPEQAAIVRYLDHADRRISRYIRAKQRLVELLEEEKQAIIHRAVTRGLDPYVPLKPSGVEWLADVPAHWEVTRIKNEFDCLNSRRIPLSSAQRGALTVREYDYYGASGVIDKVHDFIFDEDLILIAEDGANLVLRNLPLAIMARGKFWVNNHAHILRPKRGNLEFLAALIETLDYRGWVSGAAQPKLTKDRLLSITLAVPPPPEQASIIKAATDATSEQDAVVDRARQEIGFLNEYRTRLIADVVTGKLDVREAAADLPAVDPADLEDIIEIDEVAVAELAPELEEVAT